MKAKAQFHLLGLGLAATIGFAAIGNTHRDLLAEVTHCQFDADCAVVAAAFEGPALCVNDRPGRDPYCASGLEKPPSAEVASALALGRRDAAADIAWLQVVQFIGAPDSAAIKHAGIENWIKLINELDPKFRQPYFHAAILLVTSPDRAHVADEILAAGIKQFTDDPRAWEWHLWRGWVQYFGMLEPALAAESFRLSFEKGGPKYLEAFANDLLTARQSCGDLWGRLNTARQAEGRTVQGELLSDRHALDVLTNCWEVYLTAAVQKYKVMMMAEATSLDELRPVGLLPEEPPVIPGMCWKIDNIRVYLRSCGEPTPEKEAE
jgi:hypothetical protein